MVNVIDGDGSDDGYSFGSGDGSGDGSGCGYGYGFGDGSGYGSGNGSGYGFGSGDGSGDGGGMEFDAVAEDSSETVQKSLTVAETPIDSVEFKAAVRLTPMSVGQAMTEFYSCGYEKEDLQAFLAGIEFAEKHHGIE